MFRHLSNQLLDGTLAKTNEVPSTNWFDRWRHIIVQSTSTKQTKLILTLTLNPNPNPNPTPNPTKPY